MEVSKALLSKILESTPEDPSSKLNPAQRKNHQRRLLPLLKLMISAAELGLPKSLDKLRNVYRQIEETCFINTQESRKYTECRDYCEFSVNLIFNSEQQAKSLEKAKQSYQQLISVDQSQQNL